MLPTVSGAEKGSKVPTRGARIPHVRRHFYFGTECRARIINFARNGLMNPFDLGHKGWKYTTVLLATHQELLKPLGYVTRDVDEGGSVSIITAGSPMVGTPINVQLI